MHGISMRPEAKRAQLSVPAQISLRIQGRRTGCGTCNYVLWYNTLAGA
jgi:hypothetical protein